MSILQYKYKAHRLVNTLFYVIVFVIGFVLGFGAKEIDFNKLLSQVLMIDNVSAYAIYEDDNITIDENEIHNKFTSYYETKNIEIDFSESSYIYCEFFNTYDTRLSCIAMSSDVFNSLEHKTTNESIGTYGFLIDKNNFKLHEDYFTFQYTYKSNSFYNYNPEYIYFNYLSSVTNDYNYTNFDIKIDGELRNDWNLLDFSKLGLNLKFNENLFKDNPDFKEVCVNIDANFAITSNKITHSDENGLKFFNAVDFIWFSYVPKGLETRLYDGENEDNVTIPNEDGPIYNGINPGKWYYLDEKDKIDSFFNTDSSKGEIYPGIILQLEGYLSKYSYFGWYFHPFVIHFDNTDIDGNVFNIFNFKDNVEFYSVLENGLDFYKELENARNGNICFYIKNEYDVTILNKDIYDDVMGEITILEGDKFNINTSYNSSNLDSKGLFSKINLFINYIKDSVVFVNNYIFELYNSMPYIVQLFILSLLGLIVIKIIVGMVTR